MCCTLTQVRIHYVHVHPPRNVLARRLSLSFCSSCSLFLSGSTFLKRNRFPPLLSSSLSFSFFMLPFARRFSSSVCLERSGLLLTYLSVYTSTVPTTTTVQLPYTQLEERPVGGLSTQVFFGRVDSQCECVKHGLALSFFPPSPSSH